MHVFTNIFRDFIDVFPHHSNGAYGCYNGYRIVVFTDIFNDFIYVFTVIFHDFMHVFTGIFRDFTHVFPHHSNGAYGC